MIMSVAPVKQYFQLSEGFQAEQKSKLETLYSTRSWILKTGASVALSVIGARLFKEAGVELISSDTIDRLTYPLLGITAYLTAASLFVTKMKIQNAKVISPEHKKALSIFSWAVTGVMAFQVAFLIAANLNKRGIEFIPSSVINQLNPSYVVAISAIILVIAEIGLIKLTNPVFLISNTQSKAEVKSLIDEVKGLLRDAEDLQAAKANQEQQRQFEGKMASLEAKGDEGSANIASLFREVRKADELRGVSSQPTTWTSLLDRLKNSLERQLAQPLNVRVMDSKTSNLEERIYIDPETSALIAQYRETNTLELQKKEQRDQVQEALIRLFIGDSMDKISEDLKIPTAKLEAWKQVADPRIDALAKDQGKYLNKWKLRDELILIVDQIVSSMNDNIQNDNNKVE